MEAGVDVIIEPALRHGGPSRIQQGMHPEGADVSALDPTSSRVIKALTGFELARASACQGSRRASSCRCALIRCNIPNSSSVSSFTLRLTAAICAT